MHLTPREKEVLAFLLSGHTNKEIADRLCISTYTVRDHVSILLRKGCVRNRTELFSSRLLPALVESTVRTTRHFPGVPVAIDGEVLETCGCY